MHAETPASDRGPLKPLEFIHTVEKPANFTSFDHVYPYDRETHKLTFIHSVEKPASFVDVNPYGRDSLKFQLFFTITLMHTVDKLLIKLTLLHCHVYPLEDKPYFNVHEFTSLQLCAFFFFFI